MEFNTLSLSITMIILIITVGISIAGFSNQKVIDDLIFYPPAISRRKQWYRFITCGFIHADVMHLVFNMYSFYAIGRIVESDFKQLYGSNAMLMYVALYLSSLIVCLLPTYFKNEDNYYYKSLGASGAVSAVVFVFIMLRPTLKLDIMFILPMRGFIFGIVYLVITAILDKRGGSGINHSAHLWGAIYGIVFIIVTAYYMGNYPVVGHFVDQVKDMFNGGIFGR